MTLPSTNPGGPIVPTLQAMAGATRAEGAALLCVPNDPSSVLDLWLLDPRRGGFKSCHAPPLPPDDAFGIWIRSSTVGTVAAERAVDLRPETQAALDRHLHPGARLFGIVDRCDGGTLALALSRQGEDDVFPADAIEAARDSLSQLRNGIAAERWRGVAEGVLDGLRYGYALLRRGMVLTLNERAASDLGQSDGLSLQGNQIVASRSATQARLQWMLQSFAKSTPPGHPSIPVERPSGLRPWILTLRPFPRAAIDFGSQLADCALTIIDPNREPEPAPEVLKDSFGLTPTEARLAGHLVVGKSIAEASEDLGIRVGTARNHLKRLFSKTGTSRQAELVALLVRCDPKL